VNRANDHSKYPNWIDPSECVPYAKNAKEHTEKQIRNIANSIKRFGWQQDVVITADNVLVIGHGRRLAAIKLGCMMPYHRIDKNADQLTDKDIRELRIADNQTNAETGFDFDILQDDLDGLDFDGFDFDFGLPDENYNSVNESHVGNMLSSFLYPPFSVIFGNKGDWLERKRQWQQFGIRSELGRG